MYKAPDHAFGLLDPTGFGYLTLDLILKSYLVGRSALSPGEITDFFALQNIFKNGEGQLHYDKFRELFFPHMTLSGEDRPDDTIDTMPTNSTPINADKIKTEMQSRIRKLNKMLC